MPADPPRLAGRIALITGASRGIGAAVAKRFAAEGAHVILVARTVGALEEVDDAIRTMTGRSDCPATLVPVDLAEQGQIDVLGASIFQRFGRLDVLVGNAAMLGVLSPVAHSDPTHWQKVIELNLNSNYRLIRSMDPLLRASDAGRAIFVTANVGHAVVPFWGAYAVSKAGLEMLVRLYAAEVAKTTVRANILDPGIVRTAMRARAFPGEAPDASPPPEAIAGRFVDLAEPAFTANGTLVHATAEPE